MSEWKLVSGFFFILLVLQTVLAMVWKKKYEEQLEINNANKTKKRAKSRPEFAFY